MSNISAWNRLGANAAEIYAHYLAPAMFAPWAPLLLAHSGIAPGEHVLDVACGTGVVALAAFDRVGPAGRVVGLDINAAMLAAAGGVTPASAASIEWISGNALAMPFAEATFDVVLCQHGLQQIPDRAAALHEMHRVLKPGGRAAVLVWTEIEHNPAMHALATALERHISPEAGRNRRNPFSLSDPDDLHALLTAAFTSVSVTIASAIAQFPSPEDFVTYQLAATPFSTLSPPTDEQMRAVQHDVRQVLTPYLRDGRLAAPMEANLGMGWRN